MNNEQDNSSQVEIIALDFYDGAKEGFALSIGNLGPSYFKLIAWDENQDQRLFVVISIAKLIFDKIFGLLSLSNDKPVSKVWLPNWAFRNNKDEDEANKIIDSCMNELKSKGVLVLGDQIDSESISMFTINDSLLRSVEDAIQKPEGIDGWLERLKGKCD